MVKNCGVIVVLFVGVCLCCESPFSYSIYDAYVPVRYRGATNKNLKKLDAVSGQPLSCFKVALLADVHYHYDDLAAAIRRINADDSILFTIVIGDLTHHGLLAEFLLLYDQLQAFEKPYFTVIGNHDYLSNGGTIYSQMFGTKNYTFTFDSVKFVLFDDVFWESNAVPDFQWLENELLPAADYKSLIPLAHIQPTDDQFSAEYDAHYHQLMVDAGVLYSFHGHKHTYSDLIPFGDAVHYVTVSSVVNRSFTELQVRRSSVGVRQIFF